MLTTTAAILAQAQSYFSAPDALPAPGLLELWLNERAILTGAALLVLSVLVALGPGRGLKHAGKAGLAVAILGAAVIAWGEYHTSPREAARSTTAAFIAAVEAADRDAVEALLAEQVGVAAAGTTLMPDGRAFLLAGVTRLEQANLSELALLETQAETLSPTSARTQSQLRVGVGGGPTLVWTLMDWRKTPEDEWRLRGVDILLINGRAPGRALLGL